MAGYGPFFFGRHIRDESLFGMGASIDLTAAGLLLKSVFPLQNAGYWGTSLLKCRAYDFLTLLAALSFLSCDCRNFSTTFNFACVGLG